MAIGQVLAEIDQLYAAGGRGPAFIVESHGSVTGSFFFLQPRVLVIPLALP